MTKAELIAALAQAPDDTEVFIELGTGPVAVIVGVTIVDGFISLWPPAPLCVDEEEREKLGFDVATIDCILDRRDDHFILQRRNGWRRFENRVRVLAS